jgi:hypothetical protein
VLLSLLGALPLIVLFAFMLALLLLRLDASRAATPPHATAHRPSGDPQRQADCVA